MVDVPGHYWWLQEHVSSEGSTFVDKELSCKRTNSSQDTYNQTITLFKQHLSHRGYPPDLVNNTISEINTNLNPPPMTTYLVLVTSLSRTTSDLSHKLKENWQLIQNNPAISTTFQDNPMVTYRKPKTISSTLVRAKLPGDPPVDIHYTPTPSIRISPRTPG